VIQDIYPKEYKVQYQSQTPDANDTVFLFDGEGICCRMEDYNAAFPRYEALENAEGVDFIYLFSVGEERFFMPDAHGCAQIMVPRGYEWQTNAFFRTTGPRYLAFAAVMAQSLYHWYCSGKFCGKCGAKTAHSETERACVCTECGFILYPRISPAVITAVTNGENLLLTRYKNRPPKQYSLVAGFAEIGESLEDTVRREVMEETGVRVKNIRYYKSQPWGFTSTLLSGFICDLDGDSTLSVDESELAEAVWLPRGEIPPAVLDIALTAEMIEAFRTGAF